MGKRIDVKIIGISQSKFQNLVNNKTRKHEGDDAFVVPFHIAPTQRDIQRKGIPLRVRPFNSVALLPADVIKPQRRTPSYRSIGQEISRVLIIGPDIRGSWNRLGHYAETIPAASDTDADLVQVRYTREKRWPEEDVSAEGNPVGQYHLASLCRAWNEELVVDDWRIERTDFNAGQPIT